MAFDRREWLPHALLWCGLEFVGNCGCVLTAMHRGMVREKYGIAGDAASDLCASCCCPCCAITQIWREIKANEALVPQPSAAYGAVTPANAPLPQ
jgi:Cys-rich protein (TIGR01571 family)